MLIRFFGELVLKAIRHFLEGSRAFIAKDLFDLAEGSRFLAHVAEDPELNQRSLKKVERTQRGLPAPEAVARRHICSAGRSGFKGTASA